MKRALTYFSIIGLMISNQLLYAQEKDSTVVKDTSAYRYHSDINDVGNFPKKAIETLKQFSVSGNYRFVTNYRHLDEAYPTQQNNLNNIFIGDDSQIPQLMLNISGSVSKNTSFGTDLYMWTPMTGQGSIENVKGLNLGISLYGTHSTSFGDFKVLTGGINWYSLSPFTFQASKGYDRYSLFERNPWDPNTKTLATRYSDFYNSGAINQDERWGQQAFQGLIFEASNLPQGFSGVFMYGKTQLNGGLSPIPNSSFGGKIRKDYGNNFVSINTFNNISYLDSTEKSTIGFRTATVEFKNHIKKFQISGEVGMGRSYTQFKTRDWGEAISLKVAVPIADLFPTELHFYRISPDVINNSSAVINTSIQDNVVNTNNSSTQPVLPSVASAMVPIGQLTNNSQGFDINSQINVGRIKLSFGYSMSAELKSLSSELNYSHPVNRLVLAHFYRWDFPSNVGPYNNLSKIYRNVYETVKITNLNSETGLPESKKYFNSVEANLKYKGEVFNRVFYIYYLGQFSSAQFNMAPVTVFSESALLRTYYHQIDFYYELSRSVIWTNYFGYERIIANYDTEVDIITKRPKNQTGTSIATGFDIKLSKGAGLYLRQRWMNYKDTSFKNDKYKGFESTVEIKIFF